MSAARVLRALEAPALVAVPLVLAACAFLNLDQSALLTVVTALLAVGVFFASFETSHHVRQHGVHALLRCPVNL